MGGGGVVCTVIFMSNPTVGLCCVGVGVLTKTKKNLLKDYRFWVVLAEEKTGNLMNNQTRLDRDWTELGNLEVFRNKEIVCSYEVRSLLKGSKCYHCVCIISNKPGSVKQI